MKEKVIEPGQWWIVRFRREESYARISGYLVCANAYHAGHSGFKRKYQYKRAKGQTEKRRVYRRREWDLKGWDYRRFAYKFADFKDLNTSIRSKTIADWMKKWSGIMEVVEVQGCLFYGTVVSETVIDRKFNTTNEMEILAMEYAMGE